MRLFTSGPARVHRLQGPGNFRLMDDGRLGVLDFGLIQAMPRGWPTPSWRQDQTRRASDPLSAAQRTQRTLSIPPHYLPLQRVAAGLVGVLCSLNATVAVNRELRRWPPGY